MFPYAKFVKATNAYAFWRIRKTVKATKLRHVFICPSTWKISDPTGWIFMKFEYFSKNCAENSSAITI